MSLNVTGVGIRMFMFIDKVTGLCMQWRGGTAFDCVGVVMKPCGYFFSCMRRHLTFA
jgi:hypothetical protein